MKLAAKAVPVMGQISAFLDGAPVAFDELGAVTAAEKRAWREARRIAKEQGKSEALLHLFRHGTVDRNRMLLDGVRKTGKAAFRMAKSNTAGRVTSAPLGKCKYCGHHYPDTHKATWGRSLRLCSNPGCSADDRESWKRKKVDRLARKVFRPGSPEEDWVALNNGRGPRWEDFARQAVRGEIIISFVGSDRDLTAIVSRPGLPDRRLGGPGVKKLAKALRDIQNNRLWVGRDARGNGRSRKALTNAAVHGPRVYEFDYDFGGGARARYLLRLDPKSGWTTVERVRNLGHAATPAGRFVLRSADDALNQAAEKAEDSRDLFARGRSGGWYERMGRLSSDTRDAWLELVHEAELLEKVGYLLNQRGVGQPFLFRREGFALPIREVPS